MTALTILFACMFAVLCAGAGVLFGIAITAWRGKARREAAVSAFVGLIFFAIATAIIFANAEAT